MKKLLLIAGIMSMIAGVLSFLFAAFNLFSYHHVMDGTAELFMRLQQRMHVSFAVGIIFAVIGILCLILHAKK